MTARSRPRAVPDDTPQQGAAHAECYACPVGSVFSSIREAEPETFDHLLNAARELLQVARSALDVAEAAIDRQRGAAGRSRVRRIDID